MITGMNDLNKVLPDYKKQELSKAEEAYEYIREGIIEGIWHPGERINDSTVSEHLGINRLSVREALSKLVQDDVVEQIKWKGFYIRNITSEDVTRFVRVRVVLEELAISEIIRRNLPEDDPVFSAMKNAIEKAELIIKSGNHPGYMEADFVFHELLYKASQNKWIMNFITNSKIVISMMRNISMGQSEDQFVSAAKQSTQDHRDLLEAIRTGDEESAKELIRQHLADRFASNIIGEL